MELVQLLLTLMYKNLTEAVAAKILAASYYYYTAQALAFPLKAIDPLHCCRQTLLLQVGTTVGFKFSLPSLHWRSGAEALQVCWPGVYDSSAEFDQPDHRRLMTFRLAAFCCCMLSGQQLLIPSPFLQACRAKGSTSPPPSLPSLASFGSTSPYTLLNIQN